MSAEPRFSVLISSYNYAGLIEQAVDSALNQSYRPYEVIIVDDGSTDETAEVLRQYESIEMVRVVHQDNAGQLSAFHAGVALVRGTHVAFLDADDYWSSDYLASLQEVVASYPDCSVINSNMEFVEGRRGRFSRKSVNRVQGTCSLRVYSRQSLLGSPTSATCFATPLAVQIAECSQGFFPRWRTEADAFWLFAAGLFGATFYANYENDSAKYRIHGGNEFAGQQRSHARLMRRHLRIIEAVSKLAAGQGIDDRIYKYALDEFLTIERPSGRELTSYLWFNCLSHDPWPTKLAKALKMMIWAAKSRPGS